MIDQVLDDAERAKYEATWRNRDYRQVSPGEKGVAFAVKSMGWTPPMLIVDLGCGTGRASVALAGVGFSIAAVDIADNCLDDVAANDKMILFHRASLADFPMSFENPCGGFCTDVMEHIPPEHVDLVLENISDNIPSVFFGIAHFHDSGWGTGPLHLTVEPAAWWGDVLGEHFDRVTKLEGFNIRRADMNSYWSCENGTP